MSIPASLARLRLPVIGSPLFIISGPDLVIAQCKAGIVGAFPALNARPQSLLDEWLHRITEELAAHNRAHPDRPAAPFAVNQIVHKSNDRLEADLATCEKWQVPITITSLGARAELNEAVHNWGGITLHDVIDDRFARKAVEKGADGLIAVASARADMPGGCRRSRSCRRSASGSTGRSRCRDRSRRATRCWPRRRWAPTSPISAPPSSRPRKRMRTPGTRTASSRARPRTSSIRTSSPAYTAITCVSRSKPPGSTPTICRRATTRR